MRELDWRIRAINKRLNSDMNFELAIRGIPRNDGKGTTDKKISLTDKQKVDMENALKNAKNRKAAEYGRKTSN